MYLDSPGTEQTQRDPYRLGIELSFCPKDTEHLTNRKLSVSNPADGSRERQSGHVIIFPRWRRLVLWGQKRLLLLGLLLLLQATLVWRLMAPRLHLHLLQLLLLVLSTPPARRLRSTTAARPLPRSCCSATRVA